MSLSIQTAAQIQNAWSKFWQQYQNFNCFENSTATSEKLSRLRNPERGTGGMAAGALRAPSIFHRIWALLFLESKGCKKKPDRVNHPRRIMQGLYRFCWIKKRVWEMLLFSNSPSLQFARPGETQVHLRRGRTWLWALSVELAASDQCGILGPVLCTPLSDEYWGESSWETG